MIFKPEKRISNRFIETVSLYIITVASLGAAWVLVDPKVSLAFDWGDISFGGGFSNDLKGAVISAILIAGFTAVIAYWLGASDGGRSQSAAVARIAESAAPAAVAAATGQSVKTETMQVAAEQVNVQQPENKS